MHGYRWDAGLEPRLQRIAERVERLRQARMNPAAVQNLRHWFRIHHTYHSNAIEGNRLTLPETRAVLEDGITIAGKSLKDHLETVNLAQALDFIQELAQAKEPLGEREVRNIHAIVLRSIEGGNAGQYRPFNVRIGGSDHMPPEALAVPERMKEFAQWLSSDKPEHPLLVSAIAHAWFETIHPFVDGNGRTGRLLANLILMRHGYPVTVLRVEDRARYYTALDQSHTGDLSLMVELTLETVERSLAEYERVIQEVEVREPEIRYLAERLSAARDSSDPEYLTWKYGVEALQQSLTETADQITAPLKEQSPGVRLSLLPASINETLWRGAFSKQELIGQIQARSLRSNVSVTLFAQPAAFAQEWLHSTRPIITVDFKEEDDDPEHFVLASPDTHRFTVVYAKAKAIKTLALGDHQEVQNGMMKAERMRHGAGWNLPIVTVKTEVSALRIATDIWTYIIHRYLT